MKNKIKNRETRQKKKKRKIDNSETESIFFENEETEELTEDRRGEVREREEFVEFGELRRRVDGRHPEILRDRRNRRRRPCTVVDCIGRRMWARAPGPAHAVVVVVGPAKAFPGL